MRLSSAARLAAAYGCLMLAWTFTVPPFSAPDEWSHYLRALGIAHGELLGPRVQSYHDAALDPRQEAWVAQTVRWTHVPPGMAPDGYACNAFRPAVSASCADRVPKPPAEPLLRLTVNGTYPPAAYLLPALLVRAARGPASGVTLGRIGNAIICVALLATAAWALQPHLLGLVAAATPMVVFIGSSLNPSGPEIAGAIALLAGLLALARGAAGRATWAAVAAGGAALCLSRSLGPLWLALLGAVWLASCGFSEARRRLRAAPRFAAWAAAIIGFAALLNRAWESAYGPHLSAARSETVAAGLGESLRALPRWIREQIGVFQYLDSVMPGFAYLLWIALVLMLGVGAAWVGTRRDRFALALAAGGALVVPLLLEAFVMRPIAWTVQGRHVLPLSVAVPMVAAEVLARSGHPRERASRAAVGLCASVQLVGLYADGRRSAVGTDGSWWFPFRPEWSPALGWWPWLLVALGGVALLMSARREPT